jgi:hypothetical protein
MKTRSYRGRTVHLVDLENLAGSGHVTESHARWVRDVYLATGVVSKGDHVILGVSHHNLLAAGLGWPEARLVVLSGPNGADLALQEVMATENLAGRFGSCMAGTGDGGFAPAVAALAGQGLWCGVIAQRGHCAAALKLAAHSWAEIDFGMTDADTGWIA